MKLPHLIIISIYILLTGCGKFLDRSSLSQSPEETYWKNSDEAQAGLNALYATLPDARDFWRDCHSDNSVMTNAWGEGGMGYISMGTTASTDVYIAEEWKYDYIQRALYFINKLKDIDMDAALKQQMNAEARFILAFRYFRMVQLFGDLPLIKEVPVNLEKAALPRSPRQQVLDYVTENINIALQGGLKNQDGFGKITKAAAYMLKANVYLYRASMKKFHENQNDIELWKAAAAAADSVTTMGYDLESDYSYLFRSESNNKNREVILAYQYVQDRLTHMTPILCSPAGTGITGQGWASFCPTRDLVDSYECTDGKSIRESPLYDKSNPWENRDLRLKQTFMLPGVPVLRPDGSFSPYQPHPAYNKPEKMNNEGGGLTGFMYLKFNEPGFPKPGESFANWPIFRYAEALLILAEALNEYEPGNPKIPWAMNKVRVRSGLPAMTGLTANQDSMRNMIREERRHEFVAEHKRYFDILRWKIAEQVLSQPAYGINSNVNDQVGDWTRPKYKAQDRIFNKNKNYLWPVPQSIVDRNKNLLPQNPGWN